MVPLTDLWIPIVGSAVLVFFASWIMHMVLPYHRGDYKKLPNEDRIREAIRAEQVPPGDYMFPHAASPKECSSPEMMEKFKQGPVGVVTLFPSGPPAMGKNLALWFVYCLAISLVAAYVAGRTVAAGEPYLSVFRVVGTVAFMGHSAAHATASIWKGQAWLTTGKHMFDGLVYALLTAGCFGWLWPAAEVA